MFRKWEEFVLENIKSSSSFSNFKFSIINVGAILLNLEIFKEFFFDFVFEAVDVLCRVQF